MTLSQPLRRGLIASLAVLTAISHTAPAYSQQRGIPLIRDTEVENLLRDYTRPVFAAAKVNSSAVQITIVNSRQFNAFVANGRRIFVNAGALIDSETPNQLIGVLAHETGHIVGGHLQRLRDQIERAQTLAIIGMLLGAGALAGAAVGGSNARDLGNAAPAVLIGPNEIARRSLLSYQRSEESAADRAALDYLRGSGQSAKGMIQTFKRFADQALFSSRGMDPYLQSHPMPTDRVANLSDLAEKSPFWNTKDPPALQLRHDLVRAKLLAFIEQPDVITRRYPSYDVSLPAKYARTIQNFRFGDRRLAVAGAEELIRTQPNNAYFHEIKGQILLETGQASLAVPALRKAVALAPNAGLIRMMLGHALVSTDNPAFADEAIRELKNAMLREPEGADGYRFLALAYAKKGNTSLADLYSAQAAFYTGDMVAARSIAKRAQNGLPNGSPEWVKAEEIATYRPPRVN